MAVLVDDAYPDTPTRQGGAYTILKKIRVDAGEAAQWIEVEHGLGRVPNWVRVTKLAHDVPPASPVFPAAECNPGILPFAATGDDLAWDPGEATPTYPSDVIDLRESLYFGVINAAVQDAAFFLVEIGVTHSVPK